MQQQTSISEIRKTITECAEMDRNSKVAGRKLKPSECCGRDMIVKMSAEQSQFRRKSVTTD